MWSSWVNEKGTTQVMYIAKLKDGPKRVKNFLNDLENIFEMVWWRGRKWNHIKRIFEVEVFFSYQNIDFLFYLKRLLELSFFFFFNIFSSSFALPFFLCSISWGLGSFDDIRGENSLLQQFLFKWNSVDWLSMDIGDGRIFQNGVMHFNMVKPWSWRWMSYGYIGGGHIFQSGGMHVDIFNS
jgi:hypothetical protein